MVDYHSLKRYYPRVPEDCMVVIIGYAPGTCPGTANVIKALEENDEWRDNHCFIVISREESSDVRHQLNHHGTFPIVFVDKKYIGGGDSLLLHGRRSNQL